MEGKFITLPFSLLSSFCII